MSKSKEEGMRAAQAVYDNFDFKSAIERALAREDRRAPYEADAIKTDEQMAVDAMLAKAARAQVAEIDSQIAALKEKHKEQMADIQSKEQVLGVLKEFERSIRHLENTPEGVACKDGTEPVKILRAVSVPIRAGHSDEGICFLVADHDNKVTMMSRKEFKDKFHFVDIVTGEPIDFEEIRAYNRRLMEEVKRESDLRYPVPASEQDVGEI